MNNPDFQMEITEGGCVAGIDEVGRGPLAGPVIASAVVFPTYADDFLDMGICDSKRLSAKKREELYDRIMDIADVGIASASVEEIDSLNIHHATHLAMKRAFENLQTSPDTAFVDGKFVPDLPCKAVPVIKGDGKSISIAAASIVAKVTRDLLMTELDHAFPGYGWASNAGYGTLTHRQAIHEIGITPHHRRSFEPVKSLVA